MAKIAQLINADYNALDNIPVINQDLSASGFTPVENTYYRHTGETGDYVKDLIYFYNGAQYKALDGTKGGTTLKKYTVTFDKTIDYSRLSNIVSNAIGDVRAVAYVDSKYYASLAVGKQNAASAYVTLTGVGLPIAFPDETTAIFIAINTEVRKSYKWTLSSSGLSSRTEITPTLTIVYFNDVEITV